MASLKESLVSSGFLNVKTYLQSGNVIFQSEETDKELLTKKIAELILNDFGHEVKVLVDHKIDFIKRLQSNPFGCENYRDVKKIYFICLFNAPDSQLWNELININDFSEELVLIKDMIYVYYSNGFGKSKLSLSFFERKLKIDATARNFNTMNKLVEILGDFE